MSSISLLSVCPGNRVRSEYGVRAGPLGTADLQRIDQLGFRARPEQHRPRHGGAHGSRAGTIEFLSTVGTSTMPYSNVCRCVSVPVSTVATVFKRLPITATEDGPTVVLDKLEIAGGVCEAVECSKP